MKILLEILACIGGACLIVCGAVAIGFLARDMKDRMAKRRESEERCRKCREHWADTEEEEKE